jgi:hypothetical protein
LETEGCRGRVLGLGEGIDEDTFRTTHQQAFQVRLPHRQGKHAQRNDAMGHVWTSGSQHDGPID